MRFAASEPMKTSSAADLCVVVGGRVVVVE